MKSKSTCTSKLPQRIELVLSPRAVTYKGTCPNSGSGGDSLRRTFPTIWSILWRVSRVSCHAGSGNSGQAASGLGLLGSKTGPPADPRIAFECAGPSATTRAFRGRLRCLALIATPAASPDQAADAGLSNRLHYMIVAVSLFRCQLPSHPRSRRTRAEPHRSPRTSFRTSTADSCRPAQSPRSPYPRWRSMSAAGSKSRSPGAP